MPEKKWPHDKGADKPCEKWVAVVPSDDADDNFATIPKAIHCSSATGGNFTAVDSDGTAVAFYINPGQFHPMRPVRINDTGLTEGLTLVAIIE